MRYDAHGNVSSRQDFNGNLTQYTYDLARNLETQRREGLKSDGTARPETRTISTAWHAYWRLPVQVAEPNKITTYAYNGDTDPATGTPLTCAPHSATLPSITGGTVPIGVLCRKTERATTDASGSAGFEASPTGLPRTWKWTYDAYGQMLTADGPRTDVNDLTTYAYYAANDPDPGKRGRLASITNALGQTTRITAYDLNGNPLAILDPNGVTTALAYDLRNRLIRRTVGDESTRYQYDGVGQLTRLTLPDGRYLAYTWDAAHRLTGIADALGNRIRYTLDAMGNRIREETQDPQGRLAQLRRHEYDALGRLAKSIGAQDQITQYEYDANGNHTRTTDPLAHITVNAYDALNRLIAITAPDKGYTLLAYDGQDRRIRVTDPRNLVTAYTLDGLGNHLQTRSPDTGVTVSTYDAAGNEITHTDAKGQITRTAYDALNRPIHITYADGRQTRYTWDAGTYGVGRLSRIDEVENGSITGSHQYAYDAQGRLRQETRTFGTLSHTTAYHYAGGQFSGMTLPSGRQVRYTRDAAGQITQVALTDIAPNAGQTRILASAIAYHPFGTIKRWTDGAGQTHTRSQDLDGRIDAYTLGSTLWRIHYDSAGRLVGQREEATPAQYGQYAYDALDRLISARLPEGSYGSAFDYAYDKAGNRIRQTMGGEARVHTIDTDSNRLLGITGRPEKAYVYDATGNRTGDGQNQWQYDARSRLVGLQGAAGAARYRVDALGRRVSKQVAGDNGLPDEVGYHYDQAGHLIAESDAQGNIRREYLWLEETPLAIVQ